MAAGALARRAHSAANKLRIAVIGAGAFGGWTALHLRNLGADVVLVDAAAPGNSISSSGGTTRVIRAIYGPDRVYVEMVKRAYELWQKLDPSLYVETGALWMHRGDDAYVRAAVPILEDLGFVVDKLTLPEARRRYPQIDFKGVKSVWFERKAGALYASRACGVVRDAFVKAGGTYRQATVDANFRMKDTDVYVFACGPWLGKLFPDVLGDWVRPTQQEVHYFEVPKRSKRYSPPDLPIWIDFGERIIYGIPAIDSHGFKVADDTRGIRVDAPHEKRSLNKENLERTRRFLAERFPELAKAPLASTEFCNYENSPDGNLIIDRHPHADNVWFIGGGSGHGFKLSPAVGELAAQAIMAGKDVPEAFRLNPSRDTTRPKTQFERKKT
ncbi:MAG TPA: FAD-dependent oxidoreductase [Thermoanaerobaculia bacterium]|nr:FAD-dependent oxidoreductase [Thermoanaerobaculia bacterium]